MDNQATTVGNVGILDEFQTQLIEAWRRLPNKAFFFALLGAWLLLFQFWGNSVLGVIKTRSLFSWMLESYNGKNDNADDSIGLLIPLLVLGLLWWKRNELLRQRLTIWLPALVIVVFAMVLHVAGYMVQEPHISIVALFIGIYGLTGLAWGWRWLVASFFPFWLFIFSVPLGDHSNFITVPLRLLVTRLVELVSHGIGIGVIRAGNQLSDPSGQYQYVVAAACSGIKSLFSIFLIATVYAFVTFRPMWKRLLVMSLAFPFAVLGNMVRMLCIVVAGALGGQEFGNYVHENTIISLLPYVPAIVGLFMIGGWMERRSAPKAPAPET